MFMRILQLAESILLLDRTLRYCTYLCISELQLFKSIDLKINIIYFTDQMHLLLQNLINFY